MADLSFHKRSLSERGWKILNAKVFANAAAAIIAVFYIVCAMLSYVLPDLIFGLANSWIHTLNLEAIRMHTQLDFGTIIYGLVSISVLTWVTAYVFIWLYNHWSKQT